MTKSNWKDQKKQGRYDSQKGTRREAHKGTKELGNYLITSTFDSCTRNVLGLRLVGLSFLSVLASEEANGKFSRGVVAPLQDTETADVYGPTFPVKNVCHGHCADRGVDLETLIDHKGVTDFQSRILLKAYDVRSDAEEHDVRKEI